MDDERVSYGELDRLADRTAAALQRDGLRPGEAVAVCALPAPMVVAVLIGVLRAGGVLVPLSPSASEEALARMLRDCGSRWLFTDDTVPTALLQAASITVRLKSAGTPGTFDDWANMNASPHAVDRDDGDAFDIIYSSGTTGTPKGIIHPHRMRRSQIERAAAYEYGPDSVTLLSTPLYSNTTLVSLLPALAYGGHVVLMRKFTVAVYLALAERHRATHTMLVPVQYRRLMDSEAFDHFDLSSTRWKFCTSAPFPLELKAEVLARWPGKLIELYGMTEGGVACVLAADEHPNKLHTVGCPAPGHDMRVIDEDERELPPGSIGEVIGRHDAAMMTGYHGAPELTHAAEWFDAQGRRFIRSGDVGRFDDTGFLVLLGRRKDLIISGGFNVYPSDLEACVLGHPAVADAAVVGARSHRWGETPVGYVIPRAGNTIDASTLLDWVNARLGSMQRLAQIILVDELPRNSLGKVLKSELRERCGEMP